MQVLLRLLGLLARLLGIAFLASIAIAVVVLNLVPFEGMPQSAQCILRGTVGFEIECRGFPYTSDAALLANLWLIVLQGPFFGLAALHSGAAGLVLAVGLVALFIFVLWGVFGVLVDVLWAFQTLFRTLRKSPAN